MKSQLKTSQPNVPKRTLTHHKDAGVTKGTKDKGLAKDKVKVKKRVVVTPQEICDFIDKLEMPIFSSKGVNQQKKWQEQKQKWGIK